MEALNHINNLPTTVELEQECEACAALIDPPTLALTGNLCATCRDKNAVAERRGWCVAPLHKSNYMLFTDRSLLVGINNKGGLVK